MCAAVLLDAGKPPTRNPKSSPEARGVKVSRWRMSVSSVSAGEGEWSTTVWLAHV